MPSAPRKAKIPVLPGQEPKDAVFVEAIDSKEPWSQYTLEDGTLLKMKSVVSEIWRVENEFDAEGNPVYVAKASNMVNVIAPEALKRKR